MSGNIVIDQAIDYEGDLLYFFFDIYFEKVRYFFCICSIVEGFKSSRNVKVVFYLCY